VPVREQQENDDRRQPQHVEQPGEGPPPEFGPAVASTEMQEQQRQTEGDRGLEEGGELAQGRGGSRQVHVEEE
jgi:hypothetical protein